MINKNTHKKKRKKDPHLKKINPPPKKQKKTPKNTADNQNNRIGQVYSSTV